MFRQHTPLPVLALGFSATLLLGIIITLFGMTRMHELVAKSESIVNDYNRRARLAYKMRVIALERPLVLYGMVDTADPFTRDEMFITFRKLGEQFFKARNELLTLPLSKEERALLEAQNEQTNKAGKYQYQIIELLSNDDFEKARTLLMEKAIPAQEEAFKRIDQLIDHQQRYNQTALHIIQTRVANTQYWVRVWGISFTMLILAVGIFIFLKISHYIRLIASSRDELAQLNQLLHENESLERAIRENILEGIITITTDGKIQSFNKAAEDMFGYRAYEVVGKPIEILMPEPHHSLHQGYIEKYLQTGKTYIMGNRRSLEALHKQGHTFPITLGITEIFQNNQRLFVGTMRDITEQRAAEKALRHARDELEERVQHRTAELQAANTALEQEISKRKETMRQLEHLATHDTLTAIPNRTLFLEHLERTIAQAQRREQQLALLYVDLDGFKEVNDSLGHQIGDRLLIEVARRFSSRIRAEDLLARIGGDEFTVVIGPSTDVHHQAESLAQALIDTLATPCHVKKHELQISASIGISLYPEDSVDASALIQHADTAMYQVKHSGKNHFAFFSEPAGTAP